MEKYTMFMDWKNQYSENEYTAAAAAAKSLQSCPTLSDPRDRSPPGSSIHGIFQARVLEWGAIAFSTVLLRQNLFLTVAVPDTGFEAQENGHTHSYGSHMAFLRLGLTISKEIHYLVGLEYWSLPFCLPSFPLLYQGWRKIVGQRTYIQKTIKHW